MLRSSPRSLKKVSGVVGVVIFGLVVEGEAVKNLSRQKQVDEDAEVPTNMADAGS